MYVRLIFIQRHFYIQRYASAFRKMHACFGGKAVNWSIAGRSKKQERVMYDLSSLYRSCLEFFLSSSFLVSNATPPPLLPASSRPLNHFFFSAAASSTTFITHFRSHLTTFQTLCHLSIVETDRRSREDIFAGARKREKVAGGHLKVRVYSSSSSMCESAPNIRGR